MSSFGLLLLTKKGNISVVVSIRLEQSRGKKSDHIEIRFLDSQILQKGFLLNILNTDIDYKWR